MSLGFKKFANVTLKSLLAVDSLVVFTAVRGSRDDVAPSKKERTVIVRQQRYVISVWDLEKETLIVVGVVEIDGDGILEISDCTDTKYGVPVSSGLTFTKSAP